MEKLASVQDVLRHAADQLEKTAEQRDWYKDAYQKLKKEADVNEVLHLMNERELETELSVDAKKADLMKKAEDGKLEIVKEAVLMSGHGGTMKLGSVDDQSGTGTHSDTSKAALNSLLLTGDDPDL